MKVKITCRPRYNPWLKKYINTKAFSKILAFGILLNSVPINSLAGMLSEDGRYETFEGSDITINNVLEEDKVDVEIEGNTLVNIFDPKDIIKVNGVEINEDKIIVENTNGMEYVDIFNKNKTMIKPNTTYTVFVNVFENNIPENDVNNEKQPNGLVISSRTDGYGEDVFYSDNLNPHNPYRNFKIEPGETGLFKTILHSKSDIESPEYFLRMFVCDKTFNRNTKVSFNVMIIEGNHIDKDIEYFEGIKSVGQDDENGHKVEIKSSNKNIFDGEMEYGDITIEGYMSNSSTTSRSINFNKISPNTEYILTGLNSKGNSLHGKQLTTRYYDINYNYIGNGIVTQNSNYTSSISPSNATYLKVRIINIDDLNNRVQVEQGNMFTPYTQYESSAKEIILNKPLRGLPNGVKDKIIKRNGQWFIERNCGEMVLDGSEDWRITSASSWKKQVYYTNYLNLLNPNDSTVSRTKNDRLKDVSPNSLVNKGEYGISIWELNDKTCFLIDIENISNIDELKQWLSKNPVTIVYPLRNTIYEPLNIDASVNLYLYTTHISTNSIIPANLKITVDRVANRAKEYSELAKENPTIENISLARMWTNKMRESILKDEFQDSVDSISEITDMTLERKRASSNVDVYIKSENMISMNLSTNSITFDDFSGVEDMIKENAVNISINSSLPYNLNAYLATDIQNNDKSNIMNKDILSIKDNSEVDYQTFTNTIDKVVLKSNCNSGNDKQHNVDLKLNGGIAHEKDVYKATIKFEAEQQ